MHGKTVRDARAPDDRAAPALGRMNEKRIPGYRSLGYAVEDDGGPASEAVAFTPAPAGQRPGSSR